VIILPSNKLTTLPQKGLQCKGAPKKVIIIGAGLAGLVAGYELTEAGHEVTILEARLRPGGRVYTLREPFSDGMYAEAGAGRIPDNHNWTMKYVKLFGLTLEPFNPSNGVNLSYIRGKRVKAKLNEEIDLSQSSLTLATAERGLDISGLWEKYVTPVLPEMLDPTAPDWPPAALRKYDRMTFAEFLREQGASTDAIMLLEMPFYKPEDDKNSALWWLREAALLQAQRQTYKIRGGNDLLPKAFAARLAEKIRYGAPVMKIEQQARNVGVVYKQTGMPQRLTADYLICTIPFSVLKRIEVVPPFSPEKQRAIARQSYDSVTRIYLQTRTRYWESEGLNGFAITDLPEDIWHATFDQPGHRGILGSYQSGAQAQQTAALPENERINSTIERMEKIFPGLRDNFEGSTTICWDEDEWACGALSILQPGEMFSLFPHIAKPEGRVHFAGEHASAWPGWMQGALESGYHAASEVAQAF
jgi:monoamine oxidase